MNLMKWVAFDGLLLGAVFAAALLVSQPAQAEHGRGYGAGYYYGQGHGRDHAGRHGRDHTGRHGHDDRRWRRDDRRWRGDHDAYGAGYPAYDDRRHGARVWCPTRRAYVFAWQLRDDRRDRDDYVLDFDDGYWDRSYDGYRERDRHYRGW